MKLKLLKYFIKSLLKIIFRVQVKNLAHYELAGSNTVILANYHSSIDVLLLSLFLPRQLVVATHKPKTLWSRLVLGFVEKIHKDPLHKNTPRLLIKALENKKSCLIFPEKTFTKEKISSQTLEGIGLVLQKSDAHILPIQISRIYPALFPSKHEESTKRGVLPKIIIDIKPPRFFSAPNDYSPRQRRHFYALKAYEALQFLHFASEPTQRTLFDALITSSKQTSSRLCIVEDIQRQPLTYKQFILRTFILGREIADLCKRKEYVGLMMPTAASTMVTFFAMHAYGRIPSMLNFSLGARAVIDACRIGHIKVIFTSRQFVDNAKLQTLIETVEQSGIRVYFLEDFREKINLVKKLAALIKSKFPRFTYYYSAARGLKFYEPAVMLFTSGSEGAPKGVVLNHQNILANCAQLAVSVDFTVQDKMFNALPVFHCFGLTAGAILPLVYGIPVFFYPSPLHYRIIPNLIAETQSTILFGTDTFLTGYAKYAEKSQLNRVRYLFAGAEKVKEKTHSYWSEKLGVTISEGYGATEAAPVISTNTHVKNKECTVGCFLPGIEHRLETVKGIQQGGRLWIKGPNLMMGYIKEEKPGVLQPLYHGWYDTGDIVEVDEDGFITILGRAKRFAKVGGEMVSLTRIEALASEVWPDYISVACALPDDKKGEKIVLLTDNPNVDKGLFRHMLKEKGLSELFIPKQFLTVDEMPVLATGKVDYVQSELKARTLYDQTQEMVA